MRRATNPIEEAQAELKRNPERFALHVPQPPEPLQKSTGDWKADQRKEYTAGWIPATIDEPGYFYGPDDAFVWIGLPYENNPVKTYIVDPNNAAKKLPSAPWYDWTLTSHDRIVGDCKMEWLAWDEPTRCNVYRRTTINGAEEL